jgi:hypothetical protein
MITSPPAKNAALRILGWVLLIGLLSGLLSCGIAYSIVSKWFVPWRALPDLPESARSIAGATLSSVDVETQSGRILRCDFMTDHPRWFQVTKVQNESDPGCEPLIRGRSPKDTIDRRLACRYFADGSDAAAYVLRGDGRVYVWRSGNSGFEVVLLYVFPAICAPLGMAFGLVIGLLRNRKRAGGAEQ